MAKEVRAISEVVGILRKSRRQHGGLLLFIGLSSLEKAEKHHVN